MDNKYQELNEYDYLLEQMVVKFTHDKDLVSYVRESGELLIQSNLTLEMAYLQLFTDRNIYEHYYDELSKTEISMLEDRIFSLAILIHSKKSIKNAKSKKLH